MDNFTHDDLYKLTNINVTPNDKELIIRYGHALEITPPTPVTIIGNINSPYEWLKVKKSKISILHSHIIVDRENLSITLYVEERDKYKDVISGSLEIHPDFKKFKINSGEYITNFQMAELFKMNRSCFENYSVSMQLVSELQNFKAKVDKEIEKADNQRGDKRLLLAQTVQSNLPEKFNLNIPLFKGTSKQIIEVEVHVRAEDLACTLISPAANDIISEIKDQELNDVLNQIREDFPELAIIEK